MTQNVFIESPVCADPDWNLICLTNFDLGYAFKLRHGVKQVDKVKKPVRDVLCSML